MSRGGHVRRQRSDEEGRGGQTKAEKGQQPHEQTSVILSRMAWLDRLRDSARCMESTSAVRSTMEGRCGLAWVSGMAVGYLANKQDKKKDTKRQHRNRNNKKIADVNACVSCSQLNNLHSPNHKRKNHQPHTLSLSKKKGGVALTCSKRFVSRPAINTKQPNNQTLIGR